MVGAGASLPVMRRSAFRHLFAAEPIAGSRAATNVAEDETYWREIQRAFDLDRTMVNLNNGGCSPAPTHVLEQMIRDLRFSNELPVDHMWRVLEPRIESVRRDLAQDFGCDPEEMAITRNASEANETMIFGLDLKKGDEVVMTTLNYPRMQNAWRQRERRDGIVMKRVKIETPVKSDDSFVEQIAAAITSRTRVIEVMHISFQTGYIAPVRRIVELARPKGIAVFVDGAHAYAHFPFTRDELGCDYYGTSLHKWLMAPIGTGFLYVRRELQREVHPLMVSWGYDGDDPSFVERHEKQGTRDPSAYLTVPAAIAWQREHDWDAQRERCHGLARRARNELGLEPLTPDSAEFFRQMITLRLPAGPPLDLKERLYDEYRIEIPVFEIDGEAFIRPSFQGYNDEADLDRLRDALAALL